MDVAEWQTRLEETFLWRGIVGGRIVDIAAVEKECGLLAVQTFHGHNVLADSFMDFYVETLQIAGELALRDAGRDAYPYYRYTLLHYVAMFRRLRAAAILFTYGYPLDGYALLRDLKDRALFLAAVIAGATTFPALLGLKGAARGAASLPEEQYEDARKRRRAEQQRVHDLMLGGKSGLAPGELAELRSWEKLFHEEVHGSHLTMACEGRDWLAGRARLSIGPTFEEISFATYMNRVGEVGWMLLRTLPFLQLRARAFGENWAHKWRVLDESFRFYVEALEALGKPIAGAVVAFLEAKFPFSPDTAYTEPT